MAHVHRIRMDGGGWSAAEVESEFQAWRTRVEAAYGSQVFITEMVIEIADVAEAPTPTTPEHTTWFRGRCFLSLDLSPLLAEGSVAEAALS